MIIYSLLGRSVRKSTDGQILRDRELGDPESVRQEKAKIIAPLPYSNMTSTLWEGSELRRNICDEDIHPDAC